MRRLQPATALVVLALALGACSTAAGAMTGERCPVTIPPQPGFTPPAPWPAEPPAGGTVWFGDADLWTALAADGEHGGRKSVWWSADFAGGSAEPTPDITVTWHRLDVPGDDVVAGGPGTNAYTAEHGWFMIAGIDPEVSGGPEGGCWEVTARYRGAELSYVYAA